MRHLRLPQLGLVLKVSQLSLVQGLRRRGQQCLPGRKVCGSVPIFWMLLLLLLILEEVLDLMGHVQEVLL